MRGFRYCLLVLVLCSSARSAEVDLDAKRAALLVHVVVDHQLKELGKNVNYSLDRFVKEPDRRFFWFEALGNFPSDQPGSAVIGNYAVDRRTGAVWDMTLCKRIEFGALREERRKLFGQYALGRSNRAPPFC